jgi:formamidopyrimidine-DNA glycosylase
MIVVSDTTPLRHLIAIGEAELLPKLYGTVIVPGAVWAELQAEATRLIVLALDPGGIDVLTADPAGFRAALIGENRTLKRALTDPRIVSGVGNAYSDEILHAARLSPLALTRKLTGEEWAVGLRFFTDLR